jgi:hypothetical protein
MLNSGFVYKDRLLPDSFRKKFSGAESVPILHFYSALYPHASKETWEHKIKAGLVSKSSFSVLLRSNVDFKSRSRYFPANRSF